MNKAACLLLIAAGFLFAATPRLAAQTRPAITSLSYNGPTIGVGDTAIFTVNATGNPPLLYQWQHDGTNLLDSANVTGSQTNMLTIVNVQTNDSGSYVVIVSNPAGSAQSTPVTLTVSPAPIITSQTVNNVVNQGSPATFAVTATGTQPLTYQWTLSSNPVLGATDSTFTIASAQGSNAGPYQVIVSNAYGTATSTVATLTVNLPPTIRTPPQNQNVPQGTDATFSVTATGASPFVYQWQFNQNDIAGATDSSFTVFAAQPFDEGMYTVVIMDTNGLSSSASATLTVQPPPSIITPPQTQEISQNANATFFVIASGDSPFTYQWQFNSQAISGATQSTYTVFNAQPGNQGTYTVVVTDTNHLFTSASAFLFVHLIPVTIVTPPTNQLILVGSNAIFTVSATGDPPLSYQWQFGGQNIAGATSSIYTVTNAQISNSGFYNVFITDTNGQFNSATAMLRVHPPIGPAAPLTFTTLAGFAGSGSVDGTGSAARLFGPQAAVADAAGNLFVADSGNNVIREITPAGVVTTIAGLAGRACGCDGTNSDAGFNQPTGITLDAAGNLYVADSGNETIRKIAPSGTNWIVTTIAGQQGATGSADGFGGVGGASFSRPSSIAADQAGNLYVADTDNDTIREISPISNGWQVTTLAGSVGNSGGTDGVNGNARFDHPYGIAVDHAGNLYVADTYSYTIRKITPTGNASSGVNWVVTTLAGRLGQFGFANGTGTAAEFFFPNSVAVDGSGNVFVADTYNFTVRKITPAGAVTTFAGFAGNPGTTDGTGAFARFNYPEGIAVDASGNVYVADTYNNTIRKATADGAVTTLAGIAGLGSADGTGVNARFGYPESIALAPDGTLVVADTINDTIRKLTPVTIIPGSTQWVSRTIAGLAGTPGANDGAGADARFYFPGGVTVDAGGNVFVADTGNSTIRKLTPNGTDYIVTTIAGSPGFFASTDGVGANAHFNSPGGVATDHRGNLFVADTGNSTIRRLTPSGTSWNVATIAGQPGVADINDGPGANAQFNFPNSLAVDNSGKIFVADTYNFVLREIIFSGGSWMVSTVPLLDDTGFSTGIHYPLGIAVDSADNLYATDTSGDLIVEFSPNDTNWVLTAVAGQGDTPGYADGTGSSAQFFNPGGIAADDNGNIFVADTVNNTVRFGQNLAQDSFLMLPPPVLQITVAGNQAILSWPTTALGYNLETSASLSANAPWTRITSGIMAFGNNFFLTNTLNPSPGATFFRLQK